MEWNKLELEQFHINVNSIRRRFEVSSVMGVVVGCKKRIMI